MYYIEYLNLPQVPEHLIESITDIINKPPIESSSVSSDYAYFKTRNVNDDLKSWLESVFDFQIVSQYQLIYRGLPIHIDKNSRMTAFNYLLDTGGENVVTSVYDKNYAVLQAEQLELRRWHRLNTSMLHGVRGIDPTRVRVSISVTAVTPH